MPIINSSFKNPPFYQFNGHLQTILPNIVNLSKWTYDERSRLTLSDGDFIDLDWKRNQANRKLIILSHGLEGNSKKSYITNSGKYFYQRGWDVLAWNCRSCSGEMNKKLRLYHHGEINDLKEIVQYVNSNYDYQEITMHGFSMGGSMTLKYLGVLGTHLPSNIKSGVAFSAPCDLKISADSLELKENSIYKQKFLKKLIAKIKIKAVQHPNKIDLTKIKEIKLWKDFDRFFNLPINGFKSSEEFYNHASCQNFMPSIQVPTLLANALNDPIVPPLCSPVALCAKHPLIYLEQPKEGGHVGFSQKGYNSSWMIRRSWEFVNNK